MRILYLFLKRLVYEKVCVVFTIHRTEEQEELNHKYVFQLVVKLVPFRYQIKIDQHSFE